MKEKGLDSSRVLIVQNPLKEGIIELRPGLEDLSLGDRKWAMVRIWIGYSDNYIKGMAIYSEEVPPEYDLVFYTRLKENGLFAGWGNMKREKAFTFVDDEGNWNSFKEKIAKEFSERTGDTKA